MGVSDIYRGIVDVNDGVPNLNDGGESPNRALYESADGMSDGVLLVVLDFVRLKNCFSSLYFTS